MKDEFRIWTKMGLPIVMLCLSVLAGGCYTYVRLDPAQYSSEITVRDNTYAGKKVYLDYFLNRARNTTAYYFYSENYKIYYGGSAKVEYILWRFCGQALRNIGMQVTMGDSPDPIPDDYPIFRIELLSLTDRAADFNIELYLNNKLILKKRKTAAISPAEYREKKGSSAIAFSLYTRMIRMILEDPEFRTKF